MWKYFIQEIKNKKINDMDNYINGKLKEYSFFELLEDNMKNDGRYMCIIGDKTSNILEFLNNKY